MNMNAVVALAQAEFCPSWVSSWGQANWYFREHVPSTINNTAVDSATKNTTFTTFPSVADNMTL